jgi:hypothetical protein
MRGLDVRNDHLERIDRPGRGFGEALADGDRARRTCRRQLDEAQFCIEGVIVVGSEADLVGVEAPGAVDLGDGYQHELEFQSMSSP